ncbi:MAG TPA: dual specificity protein phosphatase family protein [Fimbriiglobus sp.]|jgi:atypical dual specificity phosphatase|nr:dual specificity protein phosphatase family protein [Fimbriiglobus sp.]
MPPGFTWIDRPLLAALAMPESADDLAWLRRNGLDVLLSLSEEPPPRRWVNDAGLMSVHVPIVDYTAPTERQLDLCVDAIARAQRSGMGVAVHCTAGKGRTGTILAAYLVTTGQSARAAIDRVRHLRPGSVETQDQEEAVEEFARRWKGE